ncbi:type I restriction endonuclease subunit S [Carnobacterium maltaromaticum]|uniref:hypothetical protein n=1 Tax=Carnobacterium maltaromaticum TaxID=2751 RepID=UPI001246412C
MIEIIQLIFKFVIIYQAIEDFSKEWFVSDTELHSSAIQYTIGSERIPNMKAIIESKKYENYKEIHPEAKPFSYAQAIKREWREVLDEVIIPLDDELR